jgi:hypothetical protein
MVKKKNYTHSKNTGPVIAIIAIKVQNWSYPGKKFYPVLLPSSLKNNLNWSST